MPNLVSLFLPVAEIVEQLDKHIIKGEDDEVIALVEAEFEGLDEGGIAVDCHMIVHMTREAT